VQVRPAAGPEIVNKETRLLFFAPSVDGRAALDLHESQVSNLDPIRELTSLVELKF
jgi:hypothetical protein